MTVWNFIKCYITIPLSFFIDDFRKGGEVQRYHWPSKRICNNFHIFEWCFFRKCVKSVKVLKNIIINWNNIKTYTWQSGCGKEFKSDQTFVQSLVFFHQKSEIWQVCWKIGSVIHDVWTSHYHSIYRGEGTFSSINSKNCFQFLCFILLLPTKAVLSTLHCFIHDINQSVRSQKALPENRKLCLPGEGW